VVQEEMEILEADLEDMRATLYQDFEVWYSGEAVQHDPSLNYALLRISVEVYGVRGGRALIWM
jgi:hypothetical protein